MFFTVYLVIYKSTPLSPDPFPLRSPLCKAITLYIKCKSDPYSHVLDSSAVPYFSMELSLVSSTHFKKHSMSFLTGLSGLISANSAPHVPCFYPLYFPLSLDPFILLMHILNREESLHSQGKSATSWNWVVPHLSPISITLSFPFDYVFLFCFVLFVF